MAKLKRKARVLTVRPEPNEEIMSRAMEIDGAVTVRIAFQILDPQPGRMRYVGLRGESVRLSVATPGIAMQIRPAVAAFLRTWKPVLSKGTPPD